MKKLFLVCISVLLLSTAATAGGHSETKKLMKAAKTSVKAMSPKALDALIQDEEAEFYMLDVREPHMWEEGTMDVPEDIKIARGLIEFDLPNQLKDKDALIIVYCRSGKGAPLAAKTIQDDLGYTNVHYLIGGIQGWMDAGYSIFNHFGEVKLVQ